MNKYREIDEESHIHNVSSEKFGSDYGYRLGGSDQAGIGVK